jgi:hypothetical protein
MASNIDVKSPRGFIPEVPSMRLSTSASHGFFKVFMFVEGKEMIPMRIQRPQDTISIQSFVAVPGKTFHC